MPAVIILCSASGFVKPDPARRCTTHTRASPHTRRGGEREDARAYSSCRLPPGSGPRRARGGPCHNLHEQGGPRDEGQGGPPRGPRLEKDVGLYLPRHLSAHTKGSRREAWL